ncbi:MAG: GNAT family N-acetyltransferase [Casimicrobiaceae bacterium]
MVETARLNLRELTVDDADFIVAQLNDPDFIRNVADRGVRTAEAARTYLIDGPLASYRRHGFGLWLVEMKDSRAPIGICGLIQRDSLDDVDLRGPREQRDFALRAALNGGREAAQLRDRSRNQPHPLVVRAPHACLRVQYHHRRDDDREFEMSASVHALSLRRAERRLRGRRGGKYGQRHEERCLASMVTESRDAASVHEDDFFGTGVGVAGKPMCSLYVRQLKERIRTDTYSPVGQAGMA